MRKLILVCHGETDWTTTNRIQGTVDIPLNLKGHHQAEAMAREIQLIKPTAIYSSVLSRAYETATRIAEPHGLKVKKVPALNEVNQGLWQGMLVADARRKHKKLYSRWESNPMSTKPPKGEGMKEAYDRVMTEVEKILLKHHMEGGVCLVAHEIINTLIKCHFLGLDLGRIWEFSPKSGTWEILEVE